MSGWETYTEADAIRDGYVSLEEARQDAEENGWAPGEDDIGWFQILS